MSSALSNLNTFSIPFSSQMGSFSKTCTNPKSFHRFPASPSLLRPIGTTNGGWCIKAMGGEGRENNLDHMQRQAKKQQLSQQQPNRRVVQSTPIGLWDRFPSARTVQQMIDTMDRIMEDPLAYNGTSLPSLTGEETGGSYRRGRTPWEIKEGDGEYKMRFDMPGMTKRDVKVLVEDRMLVVKAEKLPKKDKEGEEEEEEWSARSYGRYNSRIALPENVEVEKIKAEVKDGVLYVTIPKVLSWTKVLDIDVK